MAKAIDIAKGRVLPLMSKQEIEIMIKLMKKRQPQTVLEWGSGISTTFFPQRIPSITKWVAIEHNPKWYEWVKKRICDKVELRLRKNIDYYSEPIRLGVKYDLIIVDGKYRRMCLAAARFLITENGAVVLHDSGRKEYTTAHRCFPKMKELCKGQISMGDGYYKHRGLMIFTN